MYSRITTDRQSTISLTTYDAAGDQADLGTFTIGIVDANGDEVVASGTSVTDNSDGTYDYTLAAQTQPNLLIATWTESGGTSFVTYIEVVRSHLFTEAALRRFDDEAISDTTTYTDNDIKAMRVRVTDLLEAQTGRAWVRRYNRAVLAGSGSRYLDVSRAVSRTSTGLHLNRPGAGADIVSLIRANDGADISTSNIVIHTDGLLQRTDAAWASPSADSPLNVTLEYEYGMPHVVDGADRIAMIIARHWLVSTRIPDTATSWTDQLGSSYSFDESRLPWEAYSWLRNHKIRGYFA